MLGKEKINNVIAALAFTPLLMCVSRGIAPLCMFTALLYLQISNPTEIKQCVYGLTSSSKRLFASLLLLFIGLCILSLLWAPEQRQTAFRLLATIASILGSLVLFFIVKQVRASIEPYILFFILIITSIYIFIEVQTDGMFRNFANFPPDLFRLNRAAVFLVLLLPIVSRSLVSRGHLAAVILVSSFVIISVFVSQSETAKLALIISIIAYFTCSCFAKVPIRLLAIFFSAFIIIMPILSYYANDLVPQALHQKIGYGTIGVRGEIWRETVEFIKQKPVFGWGINAAATITKLPQVQHLAPKEYTLLNYGHSHNIILEVWLELGLVGAINLAAIVFVAARSIETLPRNLVPAAVSVLSAIMVVSSVSHGLWQPWWWCVCGITCAIFVACTENSGCELDVS